MLDSFDLKILQAWQRRGDLGPVEMSEIVNLSASQCSRRMQALRKTGPIRAFRAVLDPAQVGLGISAYVLLTMKSHAPEAADAFKNRVQQLEEILECQKLTGTADMILKVVTRDLDSFNYLLTQQILGAPEVATAQSSIILEDVKSTTSLPLSHLPSRS
jgi:Lrp/AsnC family transcriptional regulator, leucine-responsive regulatory protein